MLVNHTNQYLNLMAIKYSRWNQNKSKINVYINYVIQRAFYKTENIKDFVVCSLVKHSPACLRLNRLMTCITEEFGCCPLCKMVLF